MQFTNKTATRTHVTALQNALDNDPNRVNGAAAAPEAPVSAFVADPEPSAPLFGRRGTSKVKTFKVDLLAGWSRA